ncbi:MAG: hypothetical protein WCW35_01665 [Bacteroidota bacterium]
MRGNRITIEIILAVFVLVHSTAFAHGGSKDVKLHINPQWTECSFQLDPALTQDAWHQFTKEAGMVTYFRPLTDAQPMGMGNYEFSILQWNTAFDDTKAAWNDTFVHPDTTHWLKEGARLGIPGFTFRTGVTDNIDIGAYWIKNPGANYGIWGGQVQYNLINEIEDHWAASVRTSVISLYGPDDLDLTVYGIDLLASKEYAVYSDWIFVSPYTGVSTYLASSHETTAAVILEDERIVGVQGMVGTILQISYARLAFEYSVATVSTLSFKVGIGF